MAYKVFSNGSVLNASEINDNLMNQSVMVFSNSTARAAALPSPLEGMLTWLEDSNKYQYRNGAGAWVDLGGSGILQVVSTAKTDTFTSASLTLGAISGEVTGLTATITPTSITSKVLVHLTTTTDGGPGGVGTILYRGGAALTGATGDAAGSRTRVTYGMLQSTSRGVVTASSTFLDSPATLSATTYSVRLHNASDITKTLYLNRTESDGNLIQINRGISTITLMEVFA